MNSPHRMSNHKLGFVLSALCFCFLLTTHANAQSHTFPTFSPGTITSTAPGGAVTTAMPVTGVIGSYTFFTVTADFIGSGDAQSSWSSTIRIEINDGSGGVFYTTNSPSTGGADDGNNTTITYMGTFAFPYAGGAPLSIEFFDNGEDGSGPYNCTINNVVFEIGGSGGTPVTITGAGATTVTGTHPNFTISSTDNDTQLSEAQVDAFVANNGYVTTDNDTQLSEAQVDAFVANNGFVTTPSPWNTVGSTINYTSGNVGIGTASPSFELQVSGNVDVTGELTAASDRQLKKNILSLDNANAKIAALNPVSYHYRFDEFPSMKLSQRKKMGLIAQEVKAIFPNLVSAAGTATKSNGEEIDILSVNYMELIPLLIKAVQEHEVDIKNKDAQIELLIAKLDKINTLENEIAQLKASLTKSSNTINSSKFGK